MLQLERKTAMKRSFLPACAVVFCVFQAQNKSFRPPNQLIFRISDFSILLCNLNIG